MLSGRSDKLDKTSQAMYSEQDTTRFLESGETFKKLYLVQKSLKNSLPLITVVKANCSGIDDNVIL